MKQYEVRPFHALGPPACYAQQVLAGSRTLSDLHGPSDFTTSSINLLVSVVIKTFSYAGMNRTPEVKKFGMGFRMAVIR